MATTTTKEAPVKSTVDASDATQQARDIVQANANSMNPAAVTMKEAAMGHAMRKVFDGATTVMAWVGGIGTIIGGTMMYRNRNNGGNNARQ